MMQVEIYRPTEGQFIQAVEFNYPELKSQLTAALEKYKGLVFTDDQMAHAKKQRAELNNFKRNLENERIRIKKQLLDPYTDFELKIKELVSMVDAANAGIDAQIKAYDAQMRDKKRQEIVEAYEGIVPDDFRQIMPLEKIWDGKWANVTTSLKSISTAIQNRFDGCLMDMDALKEMNSPYLDQIKAFYLRTLDLGKAITEGQRLENEAAKMREYEKTQQEIQSKLLQSQPQKSQEIPNITPETEELMEISFRMFITERQRAQLVKWIRDNNIRVEKI